MNEWECIWQTEGTHYTLRKAANEFARTYWDKPRAIRKWTPIPFSAAQLQSGIKTSFGAALFQVKDGVAMYRVRVERNLFLIERGNA